MVIVTYCLIMSNRADNKHSTCIEYSPLKARWFIKLKIDTDERIIMAFLMHFRYIHWPIEKWLISNGSYPKMLFCVISVYEVSSGFRNMPLIFSVVVDVSTLTCEDSFLSRLFVSHNRLWSRELRFCHLEGQEFSVATPEVTVVINDNLASPDSSPHPLWPCSSTALQILGAFW